MIPSTQAAAKAAAIVVMSGTSCIVVAGKPYLGHLNARYNIGCDSARAYLGGMRGRLVTCSALFAIASATLIARICFAARPLTIDDTAPVDTGKFQIEAGT